MNYILSDQGISLCAPDHAKKAAFVQANTKGNKPGDKKPKRRFLIVETCYNAISRILTLKIKF